MIVYLVFVAAFASLTATYVYINSMFRGGAKPNRMSWLMWSVAPFIATAAAVSTRVGWAALPVFMSGLSPFLIFLASFLTKKAGWKLTRFDYSCGLISGLALVLWVVTKNPNVAIVFAIASDALAAIPTLTKAWNHPETESAWPFAVGVFNASTSFVAATTWAFPDYAFPAYLIAINIMLLSTVYNKKIAPLLAKRPKRQYTPIKKSTTPL